MNRRKFFTAIVSVPLFGALASFASNTQEPISNSNLPYPASASTFIGGRERDKKWGVINFSWDDPNLLGKLRVLDMDRTTLDAILKDADRTKVIRITIGNPDYLKCSYPSIYIKPSGKENEGLSKIKGYLHNYGCSSLA